MRQPALFHARETTIEHGAGQTTVKATGGRIEVRGTDGPHITVDHRSLLSARVEIEHQGDAWRLSGPGLFGRNHVDITATQK